MFGELGFPADAPREDARIEQAMDAGDEIRRRTQRTDVMAALAVAKLQIERAAGGRRCYVIRSLKNPDEVRALRTIYRERLVVIGVHAPEPDRAEHLRTRIAHSHGGRPDDFAREATALMARDQRNAPPFGQNVRGAFPLADFFVTASQDLAPQIDRFVGLLFGKPIITPSRDESAMFHADAASLRSAALGRQVGAAIASRDGDILAIGCNEVPRALGGQYWDGDAPDGRDFRSGFDQSDVGKIGVLQDFLETLKRAELLSLGGRWPDVPRFLQAMLRGDADAPELDEARAMGLTEFTRDVHAEAAALMTAALRRDRPLNESPVGRAEQRLD